jgi:hypothetical protein
MSEEAAVLFANDAFYNAFTTRDLSALEAIWSSTLPIVCIHPGWGPAYGQKSVMQSWSRILSSPNSPSISCANARTHFLTDNICYVTCFEVMCNGATIATNIFAKENRNWKIVHHHASPTTEAPIIKKELHSILQ